MRRARIHSTLFLTLLLSFLMPAPGSLAQMTGGDGRPDQAIMRPSAAAGRGLASAAGYLSAPAEAAHPFTHMLLRREAHLPEGAALTLAVRASADGTAWTEWRDLEENDDLWQDSDGPDVAWSQTVDVGAAARFWQVRAIFTPSPSGALPELRRIDVNTVDVRAFAPARPPAAGGRPSPASLARPPVVSRTQWGSPDGQGSRVPPSYYPVNHLVVHHTADSNSLYPSEPDWAARVRAEWAFHTYTRRWGDVGYNYLIDPNGVIYEGRAGGDDAVAFHDTANYGSMGVVLIGTYQAVPPTDAAQNALVSLLAWKAAQKGIDPLGSSYYYGCDISSYCRPYNPGAIVPNIAGHRQVTPGHTSCPGDQAMAYLPAIRVRVKQALVSGSFDNGDLTIDEFETGFSKSSASWHEATCGFDGHTYWTYATDTQAESTNWARWRPNIPAAGSYHVYAHIPQGCDLASPPYASAQATYTITYAGGATRQVTVDHNTSTSWADLGVYSFSKGTGGSVLLSDLTGEPFSQQRIIFFDAVKWEPVSGETGAQIVGVQYDRTRLASGELLKVTFTLKNTSTNGSVLEGQVPRVDLSAGGGLGGLDNGYVYDQDECFNGNAAGSYPAFPKESDRFRITLGSAGWDADHGGSCNGATSDYPWRWGLNADLQPGQQQTIVGYIRFRTPGTYALQAGLIQEYVKYYQQGVSPKTITVTPERIAPDVVDYDSLLNPLARVYRLGDVPDNFLARTRNPLSIPRGTLVGSFAWNGAFTDWGSGGPLGQTDQFLIEQTRSFLATTSGTYTFKVSSDDGSWLWVDGQPVVVNNGLHSTSDMLGTIGLSAGVHAVAFKYFERSGLAAVGYSVQMPGEVAFTTIADGLGGGALHDGGTFVEFPRLSVAADDLGGSGIAHIWWSWDGTNWYDGSGPVLDDMGKLQNGTYHLRYKVQDVAGNWIDQHDLVFTVNTNKTIYRSYLPFVGW